MNKSVNLAEFSRRISKRLDISKKDGRTVVDAVMAELRNVILQGDKFKYPGFVIFEGRKISMKPRYFKLLDDRREIHPFIKMLTRQTIAFRKETRLAAKSLTSLEDL